mmetsp:Transcript_36055/g.50270  ORF Transcript_36055/g.50270 Transcript_36055/m.50270 type:complete len:220 (+) Transcript_36055:49-708(+)|eukprot:symbB.v1.2.012403.t1/scaffold857.1/size218589/18
MVWFRILALLILGANGKGGYSGGGYSGGGAFGGGGVVTSRAAFASAGAFGAVVLLSSGTRRRYGTYNDPNDSSMCMMLTEEEMRSSCLNLIGDENTCHDCIACETEDCMYGITNCDEYLASVFTECCIENCEEDNTIAVIIGFVVSSCICIGICGCLFMRMKAASVASQTPSYEQNYMAGSPPGPGAFQQQNPAMMVQGTVVQGQVIGTGPPPAGKMAA